MSDSDMQESPMFLTTKTVEVIYRLNGLRWNERTLLGLAEQMRRDGFTENAEVQMGNKHDSAKVIEIISSE